MATCERCGDDVAAKNAAGHYRDKCAECIQEIADESPSHRDTCTDRDCLVCNSP